MVGLRLHHVTPGDWHLFGQERARAGRLSLVISPVEMASPSFQPDIRKIANAGGVRVVAVAEYGDIDQMRRRHIFPDLGIDTGEVDLLVEPAADPVVSAVGNEVGEAADEFVVARLQSIA